MDSLNLESPSFTFFLRLPDGGWDVAAGRGVRIEETRLGASLTRAHAGVRWGGRLDGVEVVHHGRADGHHGPVHSLRLRMASEGLAFSIEFATCLEKPLFLWRAGLTNESDQAISLEALDLLQLGSDGQGERPTRRGRGSRQFGTLRLHADPGELAFFTNGFQSWSFAGALGEHERMPHTRLGPILWPENPDTPFRSRRGEFVAHMFGALIDRTHRTGILAGFLSQRQAFGSLHARLARFSPGLRLWAHGDQVELRPGAGLMSDWACLQAVDLDAPDPLAPFLEAVAVENDVRLRRAVPVGWCSWYKYMRRVTQTAIESNLMWAAEHRTSIPLQVFQIDDGYQAPEAKLLETNERFPDGLAALAGRIRERGFTPGLWLAPFITAPRSITARQHPSWILRTRHGWPANAGSTWAPLSRGLDVTHPEVGEWTRRLIGSAVQECGFRYLKLDFLYAGVLVSRRHDPTVTRAQALEGMLRSMRAAAGEEVTLLGCGCPIGSGLGVLDAMRIGTDIAPEWHPAYLGLRRILKPEPTFPAVRNVVRNVLARSGMHRRWWINDPDCLLVRQEDTRLTPDEVRTLATVLALCGGSLLVSDDLPALDEERIEWLARLLPTLEGRLRVLDALETHQPSRLSLEQSGPAGRWWLCAVLHWGEDTLRAASIDLRRFGLPDAPGYLWADPWMRLAGIVEGPRLDLGPIPGHGVALRAVRPAGRRPEWLGDTLHISQGRTVLVWSPGERHLKARLGVGRPRQGTAWLWLPGEPRRLDLDGAALPWRAVERGIVELDLKLESQSDLLVEW